MFFPLGGGGGEGGGFRVSGASGVPLEVVAAYPLVHPFGPKNRDVSSAKLEPSRALRFFFPLLQVPSTLNKAPPL